MKNLILLIPLLWLVSCVQEDMPKEPQPTPDAVGQSSIRSIEEALSIAEDAVTFTSDAKSRLSKRIKKTGVKVLTTKNSRSSNTDTLMYVVDLEDEQGFVVIAAPRTVEPIMAVTEKGSFDSPEVQANEGFQSFMAAASGYVLKDTFNLKPGFGTQRLLHKYEDSIYYDTKSPLAVKVRWGQGWPENMFARNPNTKYAGCGPVAIAQMLSCFELPKYITYTFQGRDINSERLNWYEIKKHYTTSRYMSYSPSNSNIDNHLVICSAKSETHKTIGRLLAQIAEDANSSFKEDGTSTSYDNIQSCIRRYLSSYQISVGNSIPNLQSLLRRFGGVACVMGKNVYGNGAHAWVADGVWEYKRVWREYTKPEISFDDVWTLTEERIDEHHYLHFNWGWNGYADGYFNDNVNSYNAFNPNNGFHDDDSHVDSETNVNYAKDVEYIFVH